ncbi:Ger(x)C family spore germination protein [Paenibacillus sp. PvR148]
MTIIVILTISGCSTDKKRLEKLGLINSISYDINRPEPGAEKKLLVSISVPTSPAVGGNKREFLTTVSTSGKEARGNLSRQTSKILVNGQLRNILLGKEFAEQGIWPHLDTLVRDPSIGPRVRMTVVNGNASELLKMDFPSELETGQYIYKLLVTEERNKTIPEVSILHFIRDLFDDGIDPVAPILKLNKDHLVIDGIGLFDGDRYRTRISPKDALIFACLRGNFRQGEINIGFNHRNSTEAVTLSSIINHRKVKISQDQHEKIHVVFDLHIKGSIIEYTGKLKLGKKQDQKQLEKQVSEYLKEKAELLIHQMQKNKVDSVGLGQHVRNSMSYDEWKKLNWKKVYSSIPIQCKFKVEFINYGKFQ